MALTSQSEVPAVPPVCTNSLLHGGLSPPPLGEELWKKDGKKEDHCAERKRSKEETEAKGKRKARSWLFVPKSSRARTVRGPQCPPRG